MNAYTESPVNPLPPVLVALVVVIMGVEAVFYLGHSGILGGADAVGWRLQALQRFAFSDRIFDWMLENGVWPLEHLQRFVTFSFIHMGFVHAVFASVILLALGNWVGQFVSNVGLLVIFLGASIFGALFYGLVQNTDHVLTGAYPGAYGMIGAYTYVLWLRLGQLGERQLQAFGLIGMLMGIQLLFGMLFGGSPDWVADVGGFAAGALIMVFVIPGGFQRIRDRLRHK